MVNSELRTKVNPVLLLAIQSLKSAIFRGYAGIFCFEKSEIVLKTILLKMKIK